MLPGACVVKVFATEAAAHNHARALSRAHGIRVHAYRGGVGGRDWIAVDGSLGAAPSFPGGRDRWTFQLQVVCLDRERIERAFRR